MQGDPNVVQSLNAVLGNELTAINQLFLHARINKNWGYARLNERIYHESIDAMKRADKLVNRILFLEGLPNLQYLGKLLIGEDVPEMLDCDLKLTESHLAALRNAVVACEQASDFVSRELLAAFLKDEEEYLDWLETQRQQIVALGLANYLQSQIDD
ncbi:bacterioferritin [Chitiniphilus purpureus]|uniref:Bacterioferritin n=1 Tax=Chitiniphilus purpureus TaxID=2981137 RepID=A0ABY6DK10_9NEIS|nr:bacterioferritin [Chitiniphilus sp. CD1]UXY14372.1 bacterioferritin [Chitiniphilus sp. CD1]